MSRQKISEYTAKSLLVPLYSGLSATISTTSDSITSVFPSSHLVLKVDQGIKKRGKQGLVAVDITAEQVLAQIKQWSEKGWHTFLIEDLVKHNNSSEQYLALERVRSGWHISYCNEGGVDIESNWEHLKSSLYPAPFLPPLLTQYVNFLIPILEQNHLLFLEINPLIIQNDVVIPLDMAAEVDSTASLLPTLPDRALSDSEQQVLALDNTTPASLKFHLLNPAGRIWMLLSGGGASLVLADEVNDLGLGSELANYGEYSGAPTDDDVYAYTKIILQQLLDPKHMILDIPHAIIIAGGVANFTDVAKTFSGIIRALNEYKTSLQQSHVKIFVRRGGPNEERGLSDISKFLVSNNLLGSVHGHDTPITHIITEVKEYLQ